MIKLLKKLFGRDSHSAVDPLLLAVELKRGGIYVIEAVEEMSGEQFRELSGYLKGFHQRTGCEFLILDHPFRIATDPSTLRGGDNQQERQP